MQEGLVEQNNFSFSITHFGSFMGTYSLKTAHSETLFGERIKKMLQFSYSSTDLQHTDGASADSLISTRLPKRRKSSKVERRSLL